MRRQESSRIRVGSVSLTVYRWRDAWRIAWADSTGCRHYTTRKDRAAAVRAAQDKAREIYNGSRVLLDASPDDIRILRAVADLKPTWEDVEVLQ